MPHTLHNTFCVSNLQGRYLNANTIQKLLITYKPYENTSFKGRSVLGVSIPVYQFGTGALKVLMWSQMHGNETTTTKALLDFMAFLRANNPQSQHLLSLVTLVLVPVLNPDGATAYTRVNANGVDLNRDFKAFTQPESKFLKEIFNAVAPDFCFNLHDQRTIFSAGNTNKTATLSFLSPSADEKRTITPARELSMKLIAAIHQHIQFLTPAGVGVGRYNDSFNPNCAGDHFQSLGVPTLLYEAGHYPLDYQRENTRAYVFEALLAALNALSSHSYTSFTTTDYHKITENEMRFIDLGVKNAYIHNNTIAKDALLAFQYEEVLHLGNIIFTPKFIPDASPEDYYFHKIIDLEKSELEIEAAAYDIIKQKIIHL